MHHLAVIYILQEEVPFAHPLPQYPVSRKPNLAPTFLQQKEVSIMCSSTMLMPGCFNLNRQLISTGSNQCARLILLQLCRPHLLTSQHSFQLSQTSTRKLLLPSAKLLYALARNSCIHSA